MVIYLGRLLPDASCSLPERDSETGRLSAPIRPCSKWGLPCRARRRVARWALTPPFHPCPLRESPRPLAVCSLWHFPSGRPAWALPSILPCGARTFLIPKRTRPSGPLVRLFVSLPRGCFLPSVYASICQLVGFVVLVSAHVSNLEQVKGVALHLRGLIQGQQRVAFDLVVPVHLAHHEFAVRKNGHAIGAQLRGEFEAP